MMNGNLRIMEWNANGLLNHLHELSIVLNTEKIDVCLVSETHFTKHSFVKIKDYNVYHTIHPDNRARGGSAVIIRSCIKHYEEAKYSSYEIQATTITVAMTNQLLSLTSIYCPPRYAIEADQFVELLTQQRHSFIIGGDFNAKHTHWGSRLITTKGRALYEAAQKCNCDFISTGRPTYWPTDPKKLPDLIDFFIIRNISKHFIKVEGGLHLSSDHSPIYLTVSDQVIIKENNPTLVNKYTDWNHFKNILEANINLSVPLKTIDQLEEEVDKLTRDIQNAAWSSTPEIRRKTAGMNYPKEIKELLAVKRKLRRRWHQTRAPQDKTALNRITQHLRNEIRVIKNESVNTFLSELTDDKSTEYSLWRATKCLKKSISHIPSIKKTNGQWARSNQEKAETFANYLVSIFQSNENQSCDLDCVNVIQTDSAIPFVTTKEVRDEINKIKMKKAPGYDLVTGELLKQLPIRAMIKLTNVFNAMIRLKHFPSLWKVAEIIMIPKPGKEPQEVTSYRPISLLPIMAKLFEKLFLKRLSIIIHSSNLIPSHQFGFRNQHSTIDQIHRITDVIEKSFENGKICSVVFLDVEKAFDKVWHAGLIKKLQNLLPQGHSMLLKSYLSHRFFRVKQEEAYSDLKEIKAGVPQGSVLGPLLYLLYTRDIPTPRLPDTYIATFADDTAVLSVGDTIEQSTGKLQEEIDYINSWAQTWCIKLNESKSVHVNYTNKKIHNHIYIIVNGTVIPHSNSAKYLGMTLDAKLRWKEHVKKKYNELNIRLRKMYWLLGRKSTLSLHNKLKLYKQVLKPIWTYGIQLWGCARNANRQIIQRFQNRTLRMIANAPWYVRNCDLHRDLKVTTVAEEIKKCAQSHERRLKIHINEEACKLLNNDELHRRLKRTKPFELTS